MSGGYTEKGYQLTFRAPKDDKPTIFEHGYAQFSHVIVFAPDTKSMSRKLLTTAH